MRLRLIAFAAGLLALLMATPVWANTNDAFYELQWGLTKISADKAWGTSAGNGVVVAVLDSGIDFTHPDLSDQMHSTHSCLEGACQRAGEAGDPQGHGTHVGGIVAARTGNGTGVASVAPGARLMSLQVCPNRGCDGDAVARAIRFAADKGAQVINMSLGGLVPGSTTSEWLQQFQYAWGKGVVIVVSSGNNDALVSSYAAAGDLLIVVGATGPDDERSSYSSGTESSLDVDIFAPGGNPVDGRCGESTCVLSTLPKATYGATAGTSMAAPHVAGVAALLRCQGHSNQATVDILKSTADNTPAGKRVNALKAVKAKPGGNCAQTFPTGKSQSGSAAKSKGPSPKAGSVQQQAPKAEQTQAQGPVDTSEGYIDPDPQLFAAEEKPAPKTNWGRIILNAGIAGVLLLAAAGWYLWNKRRQPAIADDDL